MSAKQQAYRQLFARVQDELPKTATRGQRGQAAKRAAELWRSGEQQMDVRSNPAGGGLIRTAIVIGLAYLGYRALKSQQQPAPEPEAK